MYRARSTETDGEAAYHAVKGTAYEKENLMPSTTTAYPAIGRCPSLRAMSSHRQASSPFHDSWKVRLGMHPEASKVENNLKVLARVVLFFPSCSAEKARGTIQREAAGTCPHLLHRNRGFYTTYLVNRLNLRTQMLDRGPFVRTLSPKRLGRRFDITSTDLPYFKQQSRFL